VLTTGFSFRFRTLPELYNDSMFLVEDIDPEEAAG
jgi:hypothetical protein